MACVLSSRLPYGGQECVVTTEIARPEKEEHWLCGSTVWECSEGALCEDADTTDIPNLSPAEEKVTVDPYR